MRESIHQHRPDDVESGLAVGGLAPSRDSGGELKRQALERELSVRVRVGELPAYAMREHGCLPVAETPEPPVLTLRLDDHDPRAVSSEQVLVPLLRGHLDHGAVDRVLFDVREPLADRAVDHDREAAPWMVVPRETGIGGEDDLADLRAADPPPPHREGPLLNGSRIHD